VRYRSGPAGTARVETVFSNWKTVSGTFAPQTISRNENGALAFSVVATSVQIGPQTAASNFKAG
jgi:hypothetical protein